jgi:hypothetical protein
VCDIITLTMRKRLITWLFVVLIIGVSFYLELPSKTEDPKRSNEISVNREKSDFVVN